MTHGMLPPLTPRIGLEEPTYGPDTGVIVWKSSSVPCGPPSVCARVSIPNATIASAVAVSMSPLASPLPVSDMTLPPWMCLSLITPSLDGEQRCAGDKTKG